MEFICLEMFSRSIDNAVTSRKVWLLLQTTLTELGHAVARHCAMSRKVAVSILDVAIGIFHNLSGRTVTLGSTQSLTEMSTMGKGGRCVGLTTVSPSCADDLEVRESQPCGALRACSRPVQGLLYLFSNKFFVTQEITEITQA